VERAAVICPRCGTTAAPSLPAVVVAPKDKTTAVLLAVFLGIWSWLYTYDRDAAKFWIGIGVGIAGAVLVLLFVGILILIGLHIWAIADVASKPDEYYRHYPNG
jgi:4-amino-4-deoxy-L-arabinose transferase-like glycosyltransferase